MKYILETERLRLRAFTHDDAPFILELLNSESWLQYIGDRNIKTSEQAIQYLENGPLKSYRQHGFGLSLVEKKDDHTAIGMCGILQRDNLECPDIGFAFLPQYWGKGYAYEMASATLTYAKDTLKIPVIAAIVLPANRKSILLLEKIGLHFKKTFHLPNSREALWLYSN